MTARLPMACAGPCARTETLWIMLKTGNRLTPHWPPRTTIWSSSISGSPGSLASMYSSDCDRAASTPVLILTAADSVEQRVRGLDLGADDFMAKPFALTELEARIRALVRRGMGAASSTLKLGSLSYDQVGRQAWVADQQVELSARELALLEILLQRNSRLVSKEQIVEHLCGWGEEVSHNAIEVYVHRLRKKLEGGNVRIATVRGLGYSLQRSTDAEPR